MVLCHPSTAEAAAAGSAADPTRMTARESPTDIETELTGMTNSLLLSSSNRSSSEAAPSFFECHALRLGSFVWLSAAPLSPVFVVG